MDAAQTLFPCIIHENGAWCPGGATCTQSYLSSLCAAHTLDTLMLHASQGDRISLHDHQAPGAAGMWKGPHSSQLCSLLASRHATFETKTIGARMRPWTVSVITPLLVNMLETGIANARARVCAKGTQESQTPHSVKESSPDTDGLRQRASRDRPLWKRRGSWSLGLFRHLLPPPSGPQSPPDHVTDTEPWRIRDVRTHHPRHS